MRFLPTSASSSCANRACRRYRPVPKKTARGRLFAKADPTRLEQFKTIPGPCALVVLLACVSVGRRVAEPVRLDGRGARRHHKCGVVVVVRIVAEGLRT